MADTTCSGAVTRVQDGAATAIDVVQEAAANVAVTVAGSPLPVAATSTLDNAVEPSYTLTKS